MHSIHLVLPLHLLDCCTHLACSNFKGEVIKIIQAMQRQDGLIAIIYLSDARPDIIPSTKPPSLFFVRSRNLLSPILIHGIWNSTVLTLLFALAQSGIDLNEAIKDLR